MFTKKQTAKVVPEGVFPDGAPEMDWKKADNIYLNRLNGDKVQLSSIWKDQKTVIIFLRKFDCPTCYTYAILFSYLRPILDKSGIRLVFLTCHSDLSEIHSFIRSFAYWLRNISHDSMRPLPGELLMDPDRQAYQFFGLHHSLSKLDLMRYVYEMKIESKLGLLKTERGDGAKSKPMSKHHVFLEIMNYIRGRMPAFIKQENLDFTPENPLWQSPGICVVYDNKLKYRYILKEQAKAIPGSPQDFVKTALDLDPSEIKDFDFKKSMKDFVEVITHKSENAKLEAQELVLGEKIGGGFESEVFKSTWMGTDVAVKYFKYQQPSREIGSQHGSAGSYEMKDNIKSFATEVAIMMSLRHKNIIQLMGFGYSAPHQFIVMEFMPRGSLFDVLGHKDTTIDAARKASFISGIVSGVAYLHGAKTPVLHQDLKSLNILVDQDWTLKIADFGIAKELKKKGKKIKKAFAEGEEEIESDTHGGTLQWMPPENIIAETPERTKEVDIYALGVVFWEIATRRRPWKGIKLKEISKAVMSGKRPSIEEKDNWNPEFTKLVEQCWHHEASKRPDIKVIQKRIQGLVIPVRETDS